MCSVGRRDRRTAPKGRRQRPKTANLAAERGIEACWKLKSRLRQEGDDGESDPREVAYQPHEHPDLEAVEPCGGTARTRKRGKRGVSAQGQRTDSSNLISSERVHSLLRPLTIWTPVGGFGRELA